MNVMVINNHDSCSEGWQDFNLSIGSASSTKSPYKTLFHLKVNTSKVVETHQKFPTAQLLHQMHKTTPTQYWDGPHWVPQDMPK